MAASHIKKDGLDFKRVRPDLKGTNSTAEEKTEETVCRLKTPWKEASSSEGGGKKPTSLLRKTAGSRKLSAPSCFHSATSHIMKSQCWFRLSLFSARGGGARTRGRGPREGEGPVPIQANSTWRLGAPPQSHKQGCKRVTGQKQPLTGLHFTGGQRAYLASLSKSPAPRRKINQQG